MADTIPSYIKDWTRELLGARGFLKAWNDIAQKKKLDLIVETIAAEKRPLDEIHNAFLRARGSKSPLDDVINQLQKPERWDIGKAVQAAKLASKHADTSRPAEIRSKPAETFSAELQQELSRIRAEANMSRIRLVDMEQLVRALTERAVLDATRIKGLETALMALAENAGVSAEAERVYFKATAQFLDSRMPLLYESRSRNYSSIAGERT